MTITTYTDREIKLQKELAIEKQLAQLNGEIASDLKADKLRLEAERDTLRQQLSEAQALIEASRNQEPVSYMSADGRVSKYASVKDMPDCMKASFNIPLYAAPVVADDLLKDAALGKTAMRFVDRAGDVHPGIDDAETICADFYKAMVATLDAAIGGAA